MKSWLGTDQPSACCIESITASPQVDRSHLPPEAPCAGPAESAGAQGGVKNTASAGWGNACNTAGLEVCLELAAGLVQSPAGRLEECELPRRLAKNINTCLYVY